MKRSLAIGEMTVAPGCKQRGMLPVPGAPDIPLTVVNGSEDGRCALILAGTHGTEYPGIVATIRLADMLDPTEVKGAILLVHLLNRPQFQTRTPFVGPDGDNLNAAYPGDPEGSTTRRIADVVTHKLLPYADFLFDLHSGDLPESLFPHAYYPAAGADEVIKASRLAGQYLRTGRLVASRSEVGAIGTAAQRGIPGLLIEFGDGGRWDEREDVALFRYGILNTLRHLDILPGEAICHPTPDSETSYSLYAEQEGLWMPAVQAGQQGICKGDLLGVITDPFGEEIGRYIAPADGMVLYQTSSLSVRVGDHLVAMA